MWEMAEDKNLFRNIPSVDEIINWVELQSLEDREIIVAVTREVLQQLRWEISQGILDREIFLAKPSIIERILKQLNNRSKTKLCTVINATGVVLHTNLGRAIICAKGIEAIKEVAENYSNLELDLETGERGSRYSHLEEYLCRLTKAEAALVVNNNASAVLLTLAELGRGKEAIVSRGELVEIGGSFRIPDVMVQSGVKLVEVGTTNKTHFRDYENAINEHTGLLLKVHTSNYRIVGFTKEVSREELVALGRKNQLPVVEDLGSGFLADLHRWGLTDEPRVQECVASGVDVVTFSGDKLLGGPQAGIIVGKREYIQRLKKHPLTRALRIDKFTVAALEATLKEYLDNREIENIPTLAMLTISKEVLAERANRVSQELRRVMKEEAEVSLLEGSSMVGGGALPTTDLPTVLIGIRYNNLSSQKAAEMLRQGDIKIITRQQEGQVIIDLRTVFERQEKLLVAKLAELVEGARP